MKKEIKIDKSYILPRDWWGARFLIGLALPLLYFLYLLFFNFVIPELSAGQKYNFEDIWSVSISTIFCLGIALILIYTAYRLLKKTTIHFTSEGVLVDNKKMIKWDDLINYKRSDDDIILLDYEDKIHRFYTGNLTYYINEDLNKILPEKLDKFEKNKK